MNGKWLMLDGDLYFFGAGGINKIITLDIRHNPEAKYITGLFMSNTQIGVVTMDTEIILEMLNESGT